MKKVLQIAGGIVLAAVIIWAIRLVVAGVMFNQMNDTIQESFKNIENNARQHQAQIQQKQLQAQQEKDRQAVQAELRRLELQKQQHEAAMLEARKRTAFNKWWQPPRWCNEETSMKAHVQCTNFKAEKRAEFENLLASGKITLQAQKVQQ